MKKCALINDLSGFGKCSLLAEIPILSVLKVEPHPLPTAVLSNQTGYDSFKKVDLTDAMNPFIDEWKKLGVSFDGVLTGFFSDEKQIEIAEKFIEEQDTAIIIVDPVMGDDGSMYDGFSNSICKRIFELSKKADIITPNVTELFILTGEKDLEKGAKKLFSYGIQNVVVTGIKKDGKIGNAVFTPNETKLFLSDYRNGSFSGTGDLFTSIITGYILNGIDIFSATKKATEFISKVIENSNISNRNDGVDFEKYLGDLL